ncbi:MAG: cytochrome P450 family protein, partial [Aggregatilineales bacterium]
MAAIRKQQILEPGMNLTSAPFTQDAHRWLAQMRDEAPVYEGTFMRGQKVYLISRYDDMDTLSRDNRFVRNPANTGSNSAGVWMPKAFRALMQNMLSSDEPDHRRLRNLVHKAFTPRRIADLETRIEAIAHQLMDEALAQRDVDFIQAYALPLPVQVIAEMIGIPPEDRHLFVKWTNALMVGTSPFQMMKAVPSIWSFMRYTRKLADKRRTDPQDDLITGLIQAEAEGEVFTEEELIAMVFLLVVAGHETTVGLIGNGTRALLNHPEQQEMLRSDMSLLPTAIEELLRYDGPLVTGEMNLAPEDVHLHGTTIPQGSTVLLSMLSANRDAAIFENPDTLDLTRSPNKHLAFGKGIHYCLGAPLARLEAHIAFRVLLERAP